MKKLLKKSINKLGYKIVKNSNADLNHAYTEEADYLIDQIGIDVTKEQFEFFRKGINLVKSLINSKEAKFYIKEDQAFAILNDLTFAVESWEELLILHEVFVDGTYNFNSLEEFVLVDIGMNVGITSLFFSKNQKCTKIFAYEPFIETLEKGRINLSMNDSSKKISVHNFGLGFPSRELSVQYSDAFKGSVGIHGVAAYVHANEVRDATLQIKDVYESLHEVFNNYRKIVFKIDCEGAEYEIIQRLSDTDTLKKISVLMIEWHLKGPTFIKDILVRNGFNVFSFNDHSTTIGMIYAVNTSLIS